MKIYMIVMSNNKKSQYYKNFVLPSWSERGYQIIEFEAVTPETIHNYSELNFADRKVSRGNHRFSETEKSVWYSHFLLWKRCLELNESIYIIEHDTILFDYIPDFSDEKIAIFAFYWKGRTKPREKRLYSWDGLTDIVSPCAGYYITPEVAQKLITKSISGLINLNVDWTVHETFEDYHPETQRDIVLFQKFISPVCVARQVVDSKIGNTIEHNSK